MLNFIIQEDDGELCSASSWYKNAKSMIQNIEECERGLGSQSLELDSSSEYFFEKVQRLFQGTLCSCFDKSTM